MNQSFFTVAVAFIVLVSGLFFGGIGLPSKAQAAPKARKHTSAAALNAARNAAQNAVDLDAKVEAGPPLKLARVAVSDSRNVSRLFGPGWCSNFETRLEISTDDSVTLVSCTGQEIEFHPDRGADKTQLLRSANNSFDMIMVRSGTGQNRYLRNRPDGIVQEFDSIGRLVRIADQSSESIELKYRGVRPVLIASTSGAELRLSYEGEVIKTVTLVKAPTLDDQGRKQIRFYVYDESGRLVGVRKSSRRRH